MKKILFKQKINIFKYTSKFDIYGNLETYKELYKYYKDNNIINSSKCYWIYKGKKLTTKDRINILETIIKQMEDDKTIKH